MLQRLLVATALLTFTAASAPAAAPATRPAAPGGQAAPLRAGADWAMADFMRFSDAGPTGSSLDTSVVSFSDPAGRRVHLVAAVHVGEATYYKMLAADFEACDAVLYEMVKPRDMAPPRKGEDSGSGIAQLQRFLKDTLDLSYQLDCIDYRAANFVHADLDTETFLRLQSERGESFASLMLAAMLKALTDPRAMAQQEPVDMVDLLTRPDGPRQIRLVLARQFGQIEDELAALGGPRSVILGERNNAAMTALRKALKDGNREIAIFYGAAHMPDLARQIEQMGFQARQTEWRAAWDLTIRPDQPSAFEQILRHLGQPPPQAP